MKEEKKKWDISSCSSGIFGRREIGESLITRKNPFFSYRLCSMMRLPPLARLFPNVSNGASSQDWLVPAILMLLVNFSAWFCCSVLGLRLLLVSLVISFTSLLF
jgi:hypothetical protein